MSTNHMSDNLRATIGLVKVQWEAKGTEKGQPPVASRILVLVVTPTLVFPQGAVSKQIVMSKFWSKFWSKLWSELRWQAARREARRPAEPASGFQALQPAQLSILTAGIVLYSIVLHGIAWYFIVLLGIASCILDSKQTNSYNCQSLRQVCKTSFYCNIVQSGTIYLNLLLFPNFSKRSQFHICLSIHPERLRLAQDILNLQWWTFCDSKSMSIEYVEGWVGVSLRGGYDC